eukprot:1160632-Pelagomonas_calceolata.AAC.3
MRLACFVSTVPSTYQLEKGILAQICEGGHHAAVVLRMMECHVCMSLSTVMVYDAQKVYSGHISSAIHHTAP